MRILVFDPSLVGGTIVIAAKRAGWDVTVVSREVEAVDRFRTTPYQLAFVCALGSIETTRNLVRRLCKARRMGVVPVVICTSERNDKLVTEAFKLGAVAELTLPCTPSKAAALAAALIRLSEQRNMMITEIGGLLFDASTGVFTTESGELELSTLEHKVLEFLVLRPGRVLSRTSIMEHLYDGYDDPYPKIIDVTICRLRKRLADTAGVSVQIQTVWGRGYKVQIDAGVMNRQPVFRSRVASELNRQADVVI